MDLELDLYLYLYLYFHSIVKMPEIKITTTTNDKQCLHEFIVGIGSDHQLAAFRNQKN